MRPTKDHSQLAPLALASGIMNSVIVLVAAIACTVAEPPLLYRDELPYYHQPIVHPYTLPVRSEIPFVNTLPFYHGFKSQYYDRDLIGQARYGHIEPGQSHHAVQDALGNKVGGFSYYDSEGKLVQTSYIADSAGYRVSTNTLPVNTLVAPVPVEDTPEVKAAKLAHLEEIEKAKARTKRDILVTPGSSHIVSPVIPTIPRIEYRFPSPHALPTTDTKPVLKKDGFLEETPEVKFAKDQHLSIVEATKIRDKLAPFTYPYFGYAPYSYRYVDPIYHY